MTRAIIVATGADSTPAGQQMPIPNFLLPLVDRPFIQHVVEYFIGRGVTEYDFILSDHPEKIENLLGDGKRWGARFRYHLARDSRRPYDAIKRLAEASGDRPVLLGHADRLPAVEIDETADSPAFYYWLDRSIKPADDQAQWTGWAILSPTQIAVLPDSLNEPRLEAHLISIFSRGGVIKKSERLLSAESHQKLIVAQSQVLTGQFPGLLMTGRETAPAIRIGRHARVHPQAQLIAPVFLGENCLVEKGAILGPNVVIGPESLVDRGATIADSLVCARSYIGENLALKNVLLDGSRLINARMGKTVTVGMNSSLASFSPDEFRSHLSNGLSRATAAVLLLLTFPLWFAIGWGQRLRRGGPVWRFREAVRLPAPPDDEDWRAFGLWSFADPRSPAGPGKGFFSRLRFILLELLPRLRNVVSGELHLFGVNPRTRAEIDRLSPEWRSLYLSQKAGWIAPSMLLRNPNDGSHELPPIDIFGIADLMAKRYAK